MLFYILATVVIIIMLVAFCSDYDYDGFWYSLWLAIVSGFISAFISFLILGITAPLASWLPTSSVTEVQEPIKLKSLGNSSSVEGEGHQFLISGSMTVDGKRVINYTSQDGDWLTIDQVDAKKARIIEDGSKELIITETYEKAGWWTPFYNHDDDDDLYEFHIPEGSAVNDFVVDNK